LGTEAGTLQTLNIGLLKTGDTIEFFNINFLDAIANLYSPSFSTFGLVTSIGPLNVSPTLNPNDREDGNLVTTTFGTLIFSKVSDVTFSATLDAPEPSSAGLMGLALIGAFSVVKSTYKPSTSSR
jgi:hypothetical protein